MRGSRNWAGALGSGERCAPPAASRCSRAARVRAPFRGDPPHDGRFAPHVPPALAKRACCRVFSATRVHADLLCGGNAQWLSPCYRRGQHVRGGSPREGTRSELASAAVTGGGAQRSPEPDALYYTNIII